MAQKMPVLYIPHGGGPWPFIEQRPPYSWDDLGVYLKGLGASLGRKPDAILIISAHWEEAVFTVQNGAAPGMIYDYSGFPPETYRLNYPAPGAPQVAARAQELLSQEKITVATNSTRGYDHGTFIPLMMIYPDAKVPIAQMSLMKNLDPEAHIAAGLALEPLRHEGVLILCSGMSYHNLAHFGRSQGAVASAAFDDWLSSAVEMPDTEQRNQLLRHWKTAPFARAVHPREEHLLPLMVAAGAAGEDRGKKAFKGAYGGARYSGFQFGV